jgi:site-specific DNA recombinase
MERVRRLIRDGVVDVELSYAVDRLARNQTRLAVLLDEAEEAGVMLECVTEKVEDSPLGKLVMSLRAFAAEVEREKILERTTRGKLERAKSGRIPLAFGRGCYGYVYNPAIGQREIEPFQAEVVRRKDGRLHRKQVERPTEDRVEIVGASPRIVDDAL